jgi:hypothetical protein
MTKGNIYGKIKWENPHTLKDRRMLFCIEGRCMSGKIEEYTFLEGLDVEIKVSFIEPSHFEGVLEIGKQFTIQEASKILAIGVITMIW